MIRVENLTKRFLDRTAVDGVTFEVKKGEVLGFLGPNGAGKTTTMRILTGFVPPTSGRAALAGFDVATQSLEARRLVGYLPETIPLYPEMRVDEYLHYRASLKGVARLKRASHVDDALSRCGLGDVRRRIVGQLSKGYRQRVGLADALVHRPPILILDEPTVGLDPNQIREVRQLVRDLGREHTIILSTHILPEVEMICGRVLIIHKGRVVAQDTPENLRAQAERQSRLRIEVRGPEPEVRGVLTRIPGVQRIESTGGQNGILGYWVDVLAGEDVREPIARAVAERGWGLRELHLESLSLEDVFFQITREEEAAA